MLPYFVYKKNPQPHKYVIPCLHMYMYMHIQVLSYLCSCINIKVPSEPQLPNDQFFRLLSLLDHSYMYIIFLIHVHCAYGLESIPVHALVL